MSLQICINKLSNSVLFISPITTLYPPQAEGLVPSLREPIKDSLKYVSKLNSDVYVETNDTIWNKDPSILEDILNF